MTRPRFHFSSVARIPHDQWTLTSVLHGTHRPGSIFLYGPPGTCGGLMKLTPGGEFMTLSREEIYLQDETRWPGSRVTFQIIGDEVEFDMGPLRPRSAREMPEAEGHVEY